MKNRIIILLLVMTALSGCQYCWFESDKEERQRIFQQCMASLPKGPVTTHYNDWSEVVDSCSEVARAQSLVKHCKSA